MKDVVTVGVVGAGRALELHAFAIFINDFVSFIKS